MYKLTSTKQDIPFRSELISATTNSDVVDIGSTEGPCAMQLEWSGGSGVDFTVSLEVSNNKINWVTIPSSSVNITTNSGVAMFDPINSGAEFLRINVAVTAGSATVSAYFNGKSR